MKRYDVKITGQKAVTGGAIGAIAAVVTSKVSALLEPVTGNDPVVTGAIYSASVSILTAGYNAGKFLISKLWGKYAKSNQW